ncbi:rod shape-determining protein RodA [Candidatus Uhrbacteria bacterium CG_4_9_14_3_um_filter_36_7]|uniref:Rod shape-determining protein RodA n=1 Tax=Candidatus Uhrbacteria bacterium CG_4_9_14_3_um_filter_36_7 TaxID=1975033 RepID=A0A2M7XI95_9BACT|nr:MAG: rod shape-determining protein RodA [Candidatus Uhrbacteria bacterium CG_4_9_14_3_um_filter_36_7]
MFSKVYRFLRGMDGIFLLCVFLLVLFGFLAIYSVALSQQNTEFFLLKKQLLAFSLGFLFLLFFFQTDYRFLKGYHHIIYAICILLLLAVLIFGQTIRGTKGWFELGNISFQPVEFAKMGFIIFFARFLADRPLPLSFQDILKSGFIVLFPTLLVLLQPDMGSALLFVGVWLFMLLFAGMRKRFIVLLLSIFIGISLFGWLFVLEDYQQARLQTFFYPSQDPLGEGYNVSQALIAIGSGQWFGQGLGFGSQNQLRFLPESQTDFVFAVIAEELGFVGVLVFFFIFFLFFIRILQALYKTKDSFAQYLLFGIGSLFFLQFVVNIGMNLALLPVTGITLPFVSYGGSSLMVFLCLVGIIQSIMRQRSFGQNG